MLLLASVRQEKVPLAPVNMAEVVNQALRRLSPMLNEYQPELILPADWPPAQGYAPWLEEVWTNYLSNGLKYGGQPPCLELGATTQADGIVRFWVQDNGPGLSPEAQTALFTEFTRLDSIRAKGHGLGLSIVRRIMVKLGGQAGVESTPEQGQPPPEQPPQDGPPPAGRPGDPPDLAAAALKLGVTEQQLREALGPPLPDLAAAAAKLGVSQQALRQALGVP